MTSARCESQRGPTTGVEDPVDAVKVAFVIQTYHPVIGGSERQLQRLLPRLMDGGVAPLVLTRGLPGASRVDCVDGVRVIRLGSVRGGVFGSLTFLLAALWTLRRESPDVVHAFSLMTPASIGALHRLLQGTPLVVKLLRGGAMGDLDRIRRKPFYGLRTRVLRHTVDAVQVISEEIDRECAEIGLPEARRHRISNGVDVAALEQAEGGTSLRRSLDVGEGDPVFVYVGRLVVEKRIDLLIAAFEHVQRRHVRARLLVVGDGPERERLVNAVRRNDRIIAFGQTVDVASVLAVATIFVQPSSTEGMSNSLLEAMAVGLPIVATDVGAARELLGSSERGWLVPADDVGALQEAMMAALDVDGQLKGALARQHVTRCYDLQQTAARLLQLYRALAGAQAIVPSATESLR